MGIPIFGNTSDYNRDDMMTVLNEPIRAYLLTNGYVKEVNRTDGYGVFTRYSWGDMAYERESYFES